MKDCRSHHGIQIQGNYRHPCGLLPVATQSFQSKTERVTFQSYTDLITHTQTSKQGARYRRDVTLRSRIFSYFPRSAIIHGKNGSAIRHTQDIA